MRNILSLIKKRFVIIALVFVALVVVVYLQIDDRKRSASPSPSPASVFFHSFGIGTASKKEVVDKFGKPTKSTTEGNNETLYYPTKVDTLKNELSFQNDNLSFVKENINSKDDVNLKTLLTTYGEPERILYGPYAYSGYQLYTYPSKGIAYITNPNSGIVLEIWYFQPCSYVDFSSLWGKEYSETMPIRQ
jgi:hypothetical protein